MNLLQLVQAATSELGIPVPTLVAGSADAAAVQLQGLANSLGRELARGFDWQTLTTEYRFSTQFLTETGTLVNGSNVVTGLASVTGLDTTYMVLGTGVLQDVYVQSVDTVNLTVTLSQPANASGSVTLNFCKTQYAMPGDYDRPVNRTQWDKSKHWEMDGPLTPQQWEWLKSGYVSVAPRIKFRIQGGFFQTWPPQATAELLGLSYISANWARDKNAAGKTSFAADTDTSIFPDDLMVLGLKHFWTVAKGFAPIYQQRYEAALGIAKESDGGASTLSMMGRPGATLIGWNNIPDTGYGPQ